jgi:hypothetical protein
MIGKENSCSAMGENYELINETEPVGLRPDHKIKTTPSPAKHHALTGISSLLPAPAAIQVCL